MKIKNIILALNPIKYMSKSLIGLLQSIKLRKKEIFVSLINDNLDSKVQTSFTCISYHR